MTYLEMINIFKEQGLKFEEPKFPGKYNVWFLNDCICEVDKRKKVNRSELWFCLGRKYIYIKGMTTAELNEKITNFKLLQKKIKEQRMLSQIKDDFV